MIHVGDKVKITDTGRIYSAYPGFLDYFRQVGCSTMVERVCAQYEYGHSPTEADARDKVFKVMFIREHGSLEDTVIALINDGNKTYMIGIEGLTLVSSDMPFEVGDKVYIKDAGPIYTSWSNLIKNMSTVIPDGEEVFRKWNVGYSPTSNEVGGKSPDAIFTVKWIGHHIVCPDDAIVAIISNVTSTYIIGTSGLSIAGEKSWDKYIIYVRNWAVMNKDTAQSVRDATGPKPYAEWLNDKR